MWTPADLLIARDQKHILRDYGSLILGGCCRGIQIRFSEIRLDFQKKRGKVVHGSIIGVLRKCFVIRGFPPKQSKVSCGKCVKCSISKRVSTANCKRNRNILRRIVILQKQPVEGFISRLFWMWLDRCCWLCDGSHPWNLEAGKVLLNLWIKRS